MDAISNADRFVVLLRQKLAERAHAAAPSAARPVGRSAESGRDAVRAIAGRAARAGAEERKLRRTIVEQLLVDRFGSALVNEARFQQIVDQVSELMAADTDLSVLFSSVIAEVRAKPV
jgi:hypothetical protein